MSYTSSPPINLELKPSELPPGCTAPLRAPADARLVFNGKVILLRLVRLRAGEFVLYARWNDKNYLALHAQMPQIWRGKPTLTKLQRIAENLQQFAWSFAAVCVVPHLKSGRAVLALRRGIHLSLDSAQSYAWVTNNLRALIGFDIDKNPNTTEAANLQTALNSDGTLANFAYLWLRASPDERVEIWNREAAKRAQLEELMKYVLWCLPEVWAQTDKIRLCSTRAYRPEEWSFIVSTYPFRCPQLSPHAAEFALKWGKFWQNHFLPIHALALQENNPQFYKLGFVTPTQGRLVRTPTAHEQLEASLKLRAWLQDNAPEMLNELLPV